jgi:polyisoprenyl-phosphate glycosyltransferase
MPKSSRPTLSIVLPLHNEAAGLRSFHASLTRQLERYKKYQFEIIYCDDGSTDGSITVLQSLARRDKRIKVIVLSRNFGKEIAMTAGIQASSGAAVITLDSDGQHPVALLGSMLERWQAGAKVVVGIRKVNHQEGLVKRWGSKLFYRIFNRLTGIGMRPGLTDYCLIDAVVRSDFNRLTERNRMSRGLIDWLGFERTYVSFEASAREHGTAAYSFRKLCKLAIDSVVSLSTSPLYVMAYIGMVVLPISVLLGAGMLINTVLGDPLDLRATGGAYLSVCLLFLMSLLLLSQGLVGLYLSHIHQETQNRPLYIVDKTASIRL